MATNKRPTARAAGRAGATRPDKHEHTITKEDIRAAEDAIRRMNCPGCEDLARELDELQIAKDALFDEAERIRIERDALRKKLSSSVR